MKLVVDASAWVEYLHGSTEGQKVKELVESDKNEVFSTTITLLEVSGWATPLSVCFI